MPAQTAEAKAYTPLERIGSGIVRFGADVIGHTDVHRIPKRRDRHEPGPGKVAVGLVIFSFRVLQKRIHTHSRGIMLSKGELQWLKELFLMQLLLFWQFPHTVSH